MNASRLSVLMDELQALLERLGASNNRVVNTTVKGRNVHFEIVVLNEHDELKDIVKMSYDGQSDTFVWKEGSGINVVAA